jgi:hypothetical protein
MIRIRHFYASAHVFKLNISFVFPNKFPLSLLLRFSYLCFFFFFFSLLRCRQLLDAAVLIRAMLSGSMLNQPELADQYELVAQAYTALGNGCAVYSHHAYESKKWLNKKQKSPRISFVLNIIVTPII